jgi:alpha-beta hydrolase superfamily lysophospholipase
MDATFTVETFEAQDHQLLRYGRIDIDEPQSGVNRHPVIFVPGLGGSVKFAISFLKRLVPDHGPVYSLDARGIGLNEGLNPQPHPAEYIKDLPYT